MTDNRKIWRDAFDHSELREGRFTTMSGVPLEPVYGPDDGEYTVMPIADAIAGGFLYRWEV